MQHDHEPHRQYLINNALTKLQYYDVAGHIQRQILLMQLQQLILPILKNKKLKKKKIKPVLFQV